MQSADTRGKYNKWTSFRKRLQKADEHILGNARVVSITKRLHKIGPVILRQNACVLDAVPGIRAKDSNPLLGDVRVWDNRGLWKASTERMLHTPIQRWNSSHQNCPFRVNAPQCLCLENYAQHSPSHVQSQHPSTQ